jgi:hypothetical protein
MFNRIEEPMGSRRFGNASPAKATGIALPPDIDIDRAGGGRVRIGGQT